MRKLTVICIICLFLSGCIVKERGCIVKVWDTQSTITTAESEVIDSEQTDEELNDKITDKNVQTYIDEYVILTDEIEAEDYLWMKHDNKNVLRILIGYKEKPVNSYQHKEDYFLFFDEDDIVEQVLQVEYGDKGIHIWKNGTECADSHDLGEGCGFDAFFEDVTFDGNDDLIISVGNSRHASYYCAYIYENGSYRYERTFEHIPSYEVDRENELIYGYEREGTSIGIDTKYEYKNGEFVRIEENRYNIEE